MNNHTRGFTLLEVLVVVLIIGVLTAIAVPQYQKAVLKSRFSSVMPVAKAVADAQEVFYLGQGAYAANNELDLLDIAVPPNSEKVAVAISDLADFNYVLAKSVDNDHVHYVMYQKHSKNFPGNIHCEADDDAGKWLCEKGLGGVKTSGSLTEGFTTYILQGSSSDGHYGTTYTNQNYITLNGGDQCVATETERCQGVTVTEGGVCWAKSNHGCRTDGSKTASFDNSTCIADAGASYACSGGSAERKSTFTNDSTCEGKGGNSCMYGDFTDSTCTGTGNQACLSGVFANSTCDGQGSGSCSSYNGTATFTSGSTCNGTGYTSCQAVIMTDSVCNATGNLSCVYGSFSSSTCNGEATRGCTSSQFDHSVCNGGSKACGANAAGSMDPYFTREPAESDRVTFNNASVCNGNGTYACRGINFTNNSVCNANEANTCMFARYETGSYCAGAYCQAGTPAGDENGIHAGKCWDGNGGEVDC